MDGDDVLAQAQQQQHLAAAAAAAASAAAESQPGSTANNNPFLQPGNPSSFGETPAAVHSQPQSQSQPQPATISPEAVPAGVVPTAGEKPAPAAATATESSTPAPAAGAAPKASVAPQAIQGPAKEIIDKLANGGFAPGGKVRLTKYVSIASDSSSWRHMSRSS